MIDRLLANIAPHHCCGCGQTGSQLCDCCKNDVLDDGFSQCILCQDVANNANLCSSHLLSYQIAWSVGWREGVLERLIAELKFNGKREAAKSLAQLIDAVLPSSLENIVIVPVPTTAKNIRQRGYDHMQLIARYLSKSRGWPVERVLARQNNITQHFTKTASQRRKQAKTFFRSVKTPDENQTYLLIDDIYTTGSTISAAAECLAEAGAKNIAVAVISRQKGSDG